MSNFVELQPSSEPCVVHTVCTINQCFVFRLPNLASSAGYSAASFKDNQVWAGRLRVQVAGSQSVIQLLEEDGKVFANSPITPGSIEKCNDSSRYFVLRIVGGQGKKAHIGLGFADRSEAFDLNAALQDCKRYTEGGAADEEAKELAAIPSRDLTLKAGQTIRIQVGNKPLGTQAKVVQQEEATGVNDLTSKVESTGSNVSNDTAVEEEVKVAETGTAKLGSLSIAPPPQAGNRRDRRRRTKQ